MLTKPSISVIVVAYNMRREIERTLHTLSQAYQAQSADAEYEVIVVDNGSAEPLTDQEVSRFGPRFSLIRPPEIRVSPALALNFGASQSTGDILACMIDGARMLSPGCISWTLRAFQAFRNPVVSVPSWHIGPSNQSVSVSDGYSQIVEDGLLRSVDWQTDGYRLFDVSLGLDGSSDSGVWFKPLAESNFIAVHRELFDGVKGFDERFTSVGGGAVNLDFFRRVREQEGGAVVSLLGEGTFHQFHGGVSTNVPVRDHPWNKIHDEYCGITGQVFQWPQYTPVLLGPFNNLVRRVIGRDPAALD